MNSWYEFCLNDPELAETGMRMLFRSHGQVGYAFIATLRKDGAPRLHPISVVISEEHLYILIPATSPKCSDLLRDGRFAMQSFPPPGNEQGEEFYISGYARKIEDGTTRQALIEDTNIYADESEVLFELFLERVMHTLLVNFGTREEHPLHRKWHTPNLAMEARVES